jgi:DNA-directed RNA polymerase specialized sigma24 family protein
MDPLKESTKPVDLRKLSDKELMGTYCADRSRQDVAEILWERHSETIRDALKKRARLRPSTCDYRTFIDSSFSRSYLNFIRRICGFRFESPIEHWLFMVAGSAALDERRKITGKRAEAEKLNESETEESTDTGVKKEISLDEYIAKEGEGTLFRSEYFPLHTHYGQSPNSPIEKRERKYVVRELLIRHAETSDEDAESAHTIRLRYWRNWSVTELATYFYGEPITKQEQAARERAVYRDLDSNFRKLRTLLAKEFRIASPSQI